MAKLRLEYLFNGYVNNNYTPEEEEELMELLTVPENEEAVKKLIDGLIEDKRTEAEMPDQAASVILQNILKKAETPVVPLESRKRHFPIWMRVAAVAILFITVTLVYRMQDSQQKANAKTVAINEQRHIIQPGGTKAVLTISDGSRIVLDSIQNGTVVHAGSTTISKQGGLLVYKVSNSSTGEETVVYNTLSTPRGGQYQVILPDGSKVWLNAASSLHFPSAFKGEKREVDLTGEAYFEVTKNKKKPFLVRVGDMQVKVLGTHFNINAYGDEGVIKTSLLEGSVKITKGSASGLLKPGQQAVSGTAEDKVEIRNADMNEVMAWKNGLFQFDGASINTIMREIGRWYDVKIEYSGKVPQRRFEGKISRNAQLSDVLQILELSNVKFSVAGDTIIVQ